MISGLSSLQGWAKKSPDKAALVLDGVPTSYAELLRLVNRARGILDQRAVAKSGVVTVTMESMLHAWVWTLAASSLGYDTINLPRQGPNPEGPERVVIHLTDEVLPPQAAIIPGAQTISRAITVTHLLGSVPVTVSERFGSGSHILLSSGTTGQTKGIAYSDDILRASLNENDVAMKYRHDSVVYLWRFPLFTAAGYRGPPLVWHVGATVVFESDPQFGSAFHSDYLTDAVLTPGLLAHLLSLENIRRNDRLRLLVAAGSVDWVLVERCRERLTRNVWARYGSTEAGLVCITRLEKPEDTRTYSIVEGRKVRILGEAGEAVATGDTGLVWVEPCGGLSSYRSDEALSRAWFRGGWFCTGDLGRLTDDGRLQLLGRANDVIVIRGDKCPSLPYEQRIQELTGLTACLFVVEGDTGVGKARVFVETETPLVHVHIQAIGAALADLNMPVEVRPVTALPRNHMGKIVRRALLQG